MENIKYWMVVASKDHVQKGVCSGFMQACHGQANPLKRTKPHDWVIYYSPKTEFGGQEIGLFKIPQQDFELIASLMLPGWISMSSVEEEAGQ